MRLVLCITSLSMLVSSSASAQMACAKRADVVKYLADKYQERRAELGVIAGSGQMLEVFTSPAGTWTIVISQPAGATACVMIAGDGWQYAQETPAQGPGL
jgi:hypothetical protein